MTARYLTPAELAETYRDAASRADLAAENLSTTCQMNRKVAELAGIDPQQFPLLDDEGAAPDEAAMLLSSAAESAREGIAATTEAARRLRGAASLLTNLATTQSVDLDVPRAVCAPICYNAWIDPETGPDWVHEPTIEITRRDHYYEVLWQVTITEHPADVLLPSQRPFVRVGEASTQLRINAFEEGYGALYDASLTWFWRDMAIKRPTTAAEVAAILAAGGATDTTTYADEIV
jgi:hypothetical protein